MWRAEGGLDVETRGRDVDVALVAPGVLIGVAVVHEAVLAHALHVHREVAPVAGEVQIRRRARHLARRTVLALCDIVNAGGSVELCVVCRVVCVWAIRTRRCGKLISPAAFFRFIMAVFLKA